MYAIHFYPSASHILFNVHQLLLLPAHYPMTDSFILSPSIAGFIDNRYNYWIIKFGFKQKNRSHHQRVYSSTLPRRQCVKGFLIILVWNTQQKKQKQPTSFSNSISLLFFLFFLSSTKKKKKNKRGSNIPQQITSLLLLFVYYIVLIIIHHHHHFSSPLLLLSDATHKKKASISDKSMCP